MRIACVGGGPAGLVFAISMKLRDPRHEIVVFERNDAGDTFGWGVVFSDQTMENLRANDPKSADAIEAGFAHWDDIDVHIHGETITSSGHGFVGIGRKRLLNILQDRARELGVELAFRTEIEADEALLTQYDLVLACDGANSKWRTLYADHFGVDIDVRPNKYIWLGANKAFEAFTFAFGHTPTSSRLTLRPSSSNAVKQLGAGSASTRWTRIKPAARLKNSSPNISTARRSRPTPSTCAAQLG